jgi:transposase
VVFTLYSTTLKKSIVMQKIVKQVCGIDVSQKELVVTLGRLCGDLTSELFAYKVFPNTDKGFVLLSAWVKKLVHPTAEIKYVMEATGVYHERLAYSLYQEQQLISIVLPNKISNYFRTLSVKTITDKTASQTIARFGLERKLDNWKPANPVFKKLRQLTRERDQLVQTRTVAKNQIHAEQAEAEPNITTVRRFKKQILLLDKQEQEIKAELAAIVKQNESIKRKIDIITTIPGVGALTAINVLAETNGFELIRNKKQLASYAGLDVVEKQSGTSVRGKSKISKKGNRFLRKAMHLPALSAIRHDERFKAIFARLVSKHGIKMKAVTAVQRKLLELIYIIDKTGKKYESNYLQKTREQQIATP